MRCQCGAAADLRRSHFEDAGGELRLTYDRLERAALDLVVIRHDDGDSGIVCLLLHHDVAASLPGHSAPVSGVSSRHPRDCNVAEVPSGQKKS